jgi:hypothetical protein
LIRQQVPITANHIFAQVAGPRIDYSLVDASGSAIGAEAMTKNMPSMQLVPFAFAQNSFEFIT